MNKKYFTEINKCRICRSKSLTNILDLGIQKLTGVFPFPSENINSSPIQVCKCDHCHLVQLRHTADINQMYGENYGYKSSINKTMVSHLKKISEKMIKLVDLRKNDIVLDIGSNDGTLLKFFDSKHFNLIGIDPTAVKFKENYGLQDDGSKIEVVYDFFSKKAFQSIHGSRKAKLISSIACFYDLEDPIKFAQETADILANDGVWVMEMAYLPSIIRNLCFDGYVQEHLEYYSIRDIKYIMDQVGLKIIDIELTDTNGGSFMVAVTHENNTNFNVYWRLNSFIIEEKYLSWLDTHLNFKKDVELFRSKFIELLSGLKNANKVVYGLGASTKFNVVLQYCNIGPDLIPAIGEINDYKLGRLTPGSNIPIISEYDVLKKNPDYIVIGPYHFRDSFIKNLKPVISKGTKLIFPLPKLEIYGV